MKRPALNVLVGIIALSLFFVFCVDPVNPFDPSNSTVTLVVQDSHGQVTALTPDKQCTDTAGNTWKIGVCPVLYQSIDSTWIQISRKDNNASMADADSFKVFKAFYSETDTQWYVVTFKTPGERTVKAKAFLNNGDYRTTLGTFTILGRKVEITTQPISAEIDEGVLVSFTVEASGATALSYRWKHDGVAIPSNGTGATYKISETVLADSGTYTCLVKDTYLDSIESDAAKLTIIPALSPAPTKVTGLGVISRLAGTLAIKWNRAIRTDSYIILRSSSKATGYAPIDTIAVPDTMYTDKINSAAFYYEIKAYNSANKLFAVPSEPVYSSSVNKAPKWLIKDTLNLTINENAKLSINFADSVSDENGDSVWLKLAAANPSTDSTIGMTYVYTPLFTDSGTYIVKVLALDGVDTGALTMRVKVNNINRKPVFVADKPKTSYLVKESEALSFPVSATDPDGDAVTYTIRNNTLPRPATATLSVGVFSWPCLPGDMTNSSVEIGACDYKDTIWVKVNVAAGKVNATPALSAVYNNQAVARGGVVTANENDTMRLVFTVTDPDSGQTFVLKLLDRAALSCGTVSFDSANNKFSFIPSYTCVTKDTGLLGELAFVVTDDGKNGAMSAPLSDTLRVSVKVINTNRPPVINAQSLDTSCTQTNAFTLKVTATDPDSGDQTTLSATEQNSTKLPDSAAFDAKTGLLTWKPTFSQLGAYIIVFTATDGKNTSKQAVKITVKKNNRLPVFDAVPPTATIAEGNMLKIGVHATDPDNDKVTITADGKPFTMTSKATLTKDTMYWTPGFDDAGTYDVMFTATDGDAQVTASTKITVTNTNRKPVATPTPTIAQRNGTATITLSATDPDGDALSGWKITKEPTHGTQAPSPALPTILYTPATNYIGKDTISYTVSDGSLTSDVGLLIIMVDSTKIAPQVTKEPRADTTVNSGITTSVTFKVEINECFPAPTFKWYKVGNATSIGTTQTYSKTTFAIADSGNYYVVIENLAGKDTSKYAHVTVYTPPSVTNPVSVSKFLGDTAAFSVVGGGTAPLTYVWKKGNAVITDGNVTGATTAYMIIINVTGANAGSYTCEVNNLLGPVAVSQSATLNVNAKITASAGANGAIDPSGSVSVPLGTNKTFTITPSANYKVLDVLVDGVSAGPVTSYTFSNVTINHTISATFTLITYTINATAGANGTISPNGAVIVNRGAGQVFAITPSANYKVLDVLVDDVSAGAITSYTFSNVTANHTIYASFVSVYTVSFNTLGGSAIAPQSVNSGGVATRPAVSPTKAAYVFYNWNTTATGSTPFDFNQAITGPTDIYAKWIIQDKSGNTYHEVAIGSRVWMVENLRTDKDTNGIDIQNVSDNTQWANLTSPAFCWYLNSPNLPTIYGNLYNWAAVNSGKLAPSGWHVATDQDWNDLLVALGNTTVAGGRLKEPGTVHWNDPNVCDPDVSKITAFNALPGGNRYSDGQFNSICKYGSFWTSTAKDGTTAWFWYLNNGNTRLDRYNEYFNSGLSVRCVRN
jgi:uncharacterized protein (TIGR02145 family)